MIKIGPILVVGEVDPKTKKMVVKRLRRVYTDAVGPNGTVPDEERLKRAIDDAIDQTSEDDNDGIDLQPLRDTGQ